MWKPERHSFDVNLRWAWLRAVEWQSWPLFVTQPVMPIFFALAPDLVDVEIVGLLLVTMVWHAVAAQYGVSIRLASFGARFVHLKWLASPASAFLLWQAGWRYVAALALLWPVAVLLVGLIPLPTLFLWKAPLAIGLLQKAFMKRMGYETPLRTE